MKPESQSEMSNSGIPRGLLITALWIVILWGVIEAKDFLIPVCLSALLAFLMNPLTRWLRRYRVPEWVAITLSAAVLVLPLLGCVSLLVMQGQSLVEQFPKIIHSLNEMFGKLSQNGWVHRLHLDQELSLSNLTSKVEHSAGHGIQFLVTGLKTTLEAGTELVLVIIFAVVMLASREQLRRSGDRILARVEGVESRELLDAVVSLIEQFLLARLLIVFIIGAACIVTIYLFGVDYSMLTGAIIGVLTVVPEIGFVVSLVPVLVVAFAAGHSFISILFLTAILFVIHLIEANILTPKMVGSKLNINVLCTFIGLFAGGLMWGVWGMFLSVPILGILRIALSAAPSLEPWADLLAERENNQEKRLLSRRGKTDNNSSK